MFKEYYNPLCNFASSIVHDHKMAQDVVQDVFAKLWDKRESISITSGEKSYLFSAVKNRSLEMLRKKKLESQISNADIVQAQEAVTIEDTADKYMLKEALYSSIRQLPPKCQEIFVMNKINGLTYREISEELEISVKTVENHIGKAYRVLRELLGSRLADLQR